MIQEQIQRLREAVTTCYNTVSSKNGVIPEEVGDLTVRNLPEAIESIPTNNSVLTDLEVTANGEYLPADYDADGFSKVTANFNTSSLPKVKVSTFKVLDDCINEDGRWVGDVLIDVSECISMDQVFQGNQKITRLDTSNWNTSKVTSMRHMFNNCYQLQNLDVSNWNTSNVMYMQSLFHDCTSLEVLDVSKWDVSKVTTMSNMFRSLFSINSLDLTKWDVTKLTNNDYMFYDQNKTGALHSIIGSRTIEDVINNDISCLSGLSVASPTMFGNVINLDTASILALVNGLADLTGQTEQTLTLGSTIGARLDTEQLAGVPAKEYLAGIAGEKNWTISF